MSEENVVTIREFQRNFYACLQKLPLVVTKNGKPCLKIENVVTIGNVVTIPPRVGEEKRQVSPPLGSTLPPSVRKRGTPKIKGPKKSQKKIMIGEICEHNLRYHEGCHV